jgi:hypothetical protein
MYLLYLVMIANLQPPLASRCRLASLVALYGSTTAAVDKSGLPKVERRDRWSIQPSMSPLHVAGTSDYVTCPPDRGANASCGIE